ncbi:chain-length determining protein [Limnohabitans sp. TS-CS-82]|uniref:chain-length determining protein n=1 Tax=Limnohabitans sp. TS-CS-82 TaxID=2094193 RepID=UPI001F23D95F|nr:chain-length determining protein [Limnohabitans sp. TS-CS-82]
MAQPIWAAAFAFFVAMAVYWSVLASDRYVSTAHIVIQRTDLSTGATAGDLASLIGGVSGANRADQLMMRDYLLSVGLLQKLDKELDLRSHFSNWRRDPFSKFLFANAPIEWLHRYYLSRVSVELNDYDGVLVVNAQAYTPEMSKAISEKLVLEGEAFMNNVANSLAQTQVDFLEKQVVQMHDRLLSARQTLLDYQNKKGLASPMATAESTVAILAKLQASLTELQTQKSALQSYLVASHPSVVQLNQQISAVEKQMLQEQAKLASPTGKPLNKTVEEYQRLEMQAAFADAVYKTALSALERGRIEATRTIKKISVVQAPTLPEYPLEPRRIYNTLVALMTAFLLAGIAHLLWAVVQDHKD